MNEQINFLRFFFDSGKFTESSSITESILDFLPSLVYVYDTSSGRIIYSNSAFKSYVSYSKEVFQDINQLVFEEDRELYARETSIFKDLMVKETHHFNCRFNCAGQSYRYFKTFGTLLKEDAKGNTSLILFIAQDITDQMKSEEENEAKNRLFDETEELLQFGSWNWDPNTHEITWTPGMYRLFGYTKEEVGENVTIDFLLAHVLPEYQSLLQQIIRDGASEKNGFEIE